MEHNVEEVNESSPLQSHRDQNLTSQPEPEPKPVVTHTTVDNDDQTGDPAEQQYQQLLPSKPERSSWCRTPDPNKKLPDLEDHPIPDLDSDLEAGEDIKVKRRRQFCCSRSTIFIIAFFLIIIIAAAAGGGVAELQAWKR
ncbi:hypothetical protein VP1G_06723 [Cytospora mali]|uniref:Uncharacterized protein n=1 Tax=Cytospora mali TaxID=578113 RepID=A0A194V6A3_CYTMA|nr:hypothetical protein VP1G_06723 [Valsa mali var. pyri (nom. inval.)]